MKYKQIVFDVDGTLLNTEYCIIRALQDTLLEWTGREVPAQELVFVLGIPGLASARQMGIENEEAFLARWEENLLSYAHTIRAYEGIEALVGKLHDMGYELGIVTSKNRGEFLEDVHRIPLRQYFSTVICADDTVKHKPDAEPLLKYMERTGTMAKELLYIGDSKYDGQCAAGAGVDFALAMWGTHDETIPAKLRPVQPMELLQYL